MQIWDEKRDEEAGQLTALFYGYFAPLTPYPLWCGYDV